MKLFHSILFIISLPVFMFSQNTCREIIVKDVNNDTSANINCDYPFNENGCIELHAEYSPIISTSDYTVESISYAPVTAFDTGALVEIEEDDMFSPVIPVPFTFGFYGNTFNEIVIADNGVVSFDANLANGDSPFYTASLPNPALFNNAIYGLYHDITNDNDVFGCSNNPNTPQNECGEIRYQVLGSEPCRMFVINYNSIHHFNDETSSSTFQIVLYESTNIVEVHIQNKPINNETTTTGTYRKYATIGIQNENGNLAHTPDNRNSEIFETTNESWRFQPNGNSIVSVHWYEGEEMIGVGDTIEICTDQPTEIRAEALFEYSNTYTAIEDDIFPIQFDDTYPRVTDSHIQICDEGHDQTETINLNDYIASMINNPYPVEVYNTSMDAENGTNALSDFSAITISGTHQYWIKLMGDEDCFDIGSLEIELLSKPEVLTQEIHVCDINNNNSETVLLQNYIVQIVGSNPNVTTSFYSSLSNALNSQNAITQYTLSSNRTLYVRLDVEGICSTVESVDFILEQAPEIEAHINITECDNIGRVNLLSFLPEEVVSAYSNIKFYTSYASAENSTGHLNGIMNYNLNGVSTLYVRVQGAPNCYSICEIEFDYLESIEAVNDVRVQCDSDVNQVEIFDLTLSIPDMIDSTNGVEISYFTSLNAAENDISSEEITNPTAYSTPIQRTDVYVRFVNTQTGCVTIAKIVVHAVAIPQIRKDEFDFCDPEQDSIEVVDVHSMDLPIIGNQEFIVNTYFLTEQDAINNENPILSVEVAPTATVYVTMAVVFEDEVLCYDIFPVELQLLMLPEDVVNLNITICDNYNNGTEQVDLSRYQNLVEANSEINDFEYFDAEGNSIANPFNYLISDDTVIQVRQRNNIGCFSGVNLVISFEESITSSDILQYFCDPYPFDSETLNLYEVVLNDQPSLAGTEMRFYPSFETAENQDASAMISTPESFEVNQSVVIIYATIDTPTTCPSIIQLALKLTEAPHAFNDLIEICDTDNNGTETIVLSDYSSTIFEDYHVQAQYYLSEEDALLGNNPQNEVSISHNTTFYYAATRSHIVDCDALGSIQFNLLGVPESQSFSTTICDNNNDLSEILDLTFYQDQFIENPSHYTFTYFYSEEDAQNEVGAIENPEEAEITSDHSTLFVLTQNDENCGSISTFTIHFAPSPVVSDISIGSCDADFNMQETFDLTSHIHEIVENASQYTVEYYRNYNAAENSDSEYLLQNPAEYTTYELLEVIYVKVTDPDSGCYSIAKIFIEIFKLPKLIDGKVGVCDSDFDGNYEIFLPEIQAQVIQEVGAYSFEYYTTYDNALSGTNALDQEELYIINDLNDGIYIVVTNSNGCSAITFAIFYANDNTDVAIPDNIMIEKCDDNTDGIQIFNLFDVTGYFSSSANYELEFYTTLEDTKRQENEIENPDQYSNISPTQIVYVRLTEEGKCSIIEHFAIRVNRLPENPLPELLEKCPNETVTLDGGAEASSYVWSTGATTRYIEVSEPGFYTLTLTNEWGCESSFQVEVRNYAIHMVNYVFTDQHTVVFNVVGESSYEFSLDGENWQSSNVFFQLLQGLYTVYVKDTETGCIVDLPFLVFDWFNIITPNGDGKNDVWTECGLEAFGNEKSHLTIFDRYGKSIHEEWSNSCFEWDGKYLGRALPTDTYWFIVQLPDGREFSGFIAIKNYFNGSKL